MNPIEKKKFKEEFFEDLILYSEYNDISSKKRIETTEDDFKEN
jgi:hypothetical protein